ncbi:hypothetical protein WR25_24129 [Diploscapter pachys]|uniref:Solute carrier family 3 member 2 N-terminal domain-containing protein n=1 Tax=Diploscapter pachys TaxID=2018661 RepID=A0A2A2K246_9BILA|nr:hypothetical protein WR25_24129 [Diploscapter pachys]
MSRSETNTEIFNHPTAVFEHNHSDSVSSECSTRQRKAESERPLVGLTEEELAVKREQPKWRVIRYTLLFLYWLIYAGFLAGAITIIVLKNHDVHPTTITAFVTTTPKSMPSST